MILFELIYLRLPAGGGNQNPALDFVLQKLATAMNRGSVAHVVADGKPLPSDRPRILFYCCSDEGLADPQLTNCSFSNFF